MIAALVVVVAVFANFLPRIADYTDVLDVVRELSTLQLLLLAVVGVINIVTFPPPWMAALPGLSFRQGLVLTQTSTALSSAVPGGDAVGIGVSFAMLRQWRFDSHAVTTRGRPDRALEPADQRLPAAGRPGAADAGRRGPAAAAQRRVDRRRRAAGGGRRDRGGDARRGFDAEAGRARPAGGRLGAAAGAAGAGRRLGRGIRPLPARDDQRAGPALGVADAGQPGRAPERVRRADRLPAGLRRHVGGGELDRGARRMGAGAPARPPSPSRPAAWAWSSWA